MKDAVYIIRHCETSGQSPEAELTPAGFAQAQALSSALFPIGFKRIVSSDYTRAIQSAEPLALACGVTIGKDERLRERNLGTVPSDDWLGSLARTFHEPGFSFPGGESSDAATTRAMAAVGEVMAANERPVAIFTHGNLLSLIARTFDPALGFEFWRELKNPDVFELRANRAGGKLFRIGFPGP